MTPDIRTQALLGEYVECLARGSLVAARCVHEALADHLGGPKVSTLTQTRRRTSARLAGAELPDCFREAVVAAEASILARPRSARRTADRADLRRLADKARRVER